MQKVSCPNCGGEVTFRSVASVMAVCEYCQSTLLKDADSVRNIGKVAEALEDYSPIQINTSGTYQGRAFTVVGRIQLRYDAGYWNEWSILFDDGAPGWLSDASGQYVVTLPQEASGSGAPRFDDLRPGRRYDFAGTTFYASDVRTARCIAWEGELPFQVGTGWTARVADCRAGHRFLTLDYSDGDIPELFVGQAVTLEGMRCQLLRDADAISRSAGRFRGQTASLNCPSCGSGISYKAGMAFHVVCPACHAEVDCSTDKALVLQKAEELEQVATTLALGDTGNINGAQHEVIGLMQCRSGSEGDSSTWVEYLLFNEQRGFLWLVESEEGWDQVEVLNEWPAQPQPGVAEVGGAKYSSVEEYDSEVLYAAGAFNWRVSIGDRTHIHDYGQGKRKLSAESNDCEIVWTGSTRVSPALVGQWFGKKELSASPDSSDSAGSGATPSISLTPAIVYSVLLVLFNVPISFASGGRGVRLMLIAALVLWLPVIVMRYFNKRR